MRINALTNTRATVFMVRRQTDEWTGNGADNHQSGQTSWQASTHKISTITPDRPDSTLFVKLSHCHSPQTTFSSNSTCCVLSAHKSAMHVVVSADRLTTQHSIVDIVDWSWSYWQIWYPRWHVECFWHALAAHWISSGSFTYLCFATTSMAENSTIQGRLKPSHNRLLQVSMSSHRHMAWYANV